MSRFASAVLFLLLASCIACGSGSSSSDPQPSTELPSQSPYDPKQASMIVSDYPEPVTFGLAGLMEDGKLLKIRTEWDHDADSVVDSSWTYHYNVQGVLIYKEFFIDGKREFTEHSTHNSEGLETARVETDNEGIIRQEYTYEYSQDGRITKETYRHIDPPSSSSGVYTYENPSPGVSITTETRKDNRDGIIICVYETRREENAPTVFTFDMWGDGTMDARSVYYPLSGSVIESSHDGNSSYSLKISPAGESHYEHCLPMDGITDYVSRRFFDSWGNPEGDETDMNNDGSIDSITTTTIRTDGNGTFLFVHENDENNDGKTDSIRTECYRLKIEPIP